MIDILIIFLPILTYPTIISFYFHLYLEVWSFIICRICIIKPISLYSGFI